MAKNSKKKLIGHPKLNGNHYNPVYLPDYNGNINIGHFYSIIMLVLKFGTDKLLEL